MSEKEYVTVVLPDTDGLSAEVFKETSRLGAKAVAAGAGNYINEWHMMHERVEQLESYITCTLGEPLPPKDSPQ